MCAVATKPESRCAATAEHAEYAEKNRPRSASPSAYSAYSAVGLRVRYSFLAHVPVAGALSYNEKDELPPPCPNLPSDSRKLSGWPRLAPSGLLSVFFGRRPARKPLRRYRGIRGIRRKEPPSLRFCFRVFRVFRGRTPGAVFIPRPRAGLPADSRKSSGWPGLAASGFFGPLLRERAASAAPSNTAPGGA